MFYNRILKASHEFAKEHHYAPVKVFMSQEYFYNLCNETYGRCNYILVVHRRFLGMEVILSFEVKDFKLE